MTITFLIASLSAGGAERVICNLSNYLVNHDYNVNICVYADDALAYPLDDRVNVHLIMTKEEQTLPRIRRNFIRYKRLQTYITESSTDCYIAFTCMPIFLILLMRKKVKVPIIISERNNPASYPFIKRHLLKVLVHRADGYVFQLEAQYEWYKKYIKSNFIWVIPNAVNEKFIRTDTVVKRQRKIVAVGRLVEQKNHSLLLRTYAEIKDKLGNIPLIIYGEGPERQNLIQLSQQLQIDQYICFAGVTEDIGKKIEDASLFVMSSKYEGIPNSLIEAMALGLPCVATDCPVGGPKSLIQNGVNGILVKNDDIHELSNAILSVISSPTLAEKLSRNAVKIAETLAPQKIYTQWETAIRQLIQS